MVKKSTLTKKLASYSALASAVLAVSHGADAQIIYTDLNPAIIIPNPIQFRATYDVSAYLDLNNDGIADFQFSASGQHHSSRSSSISIYTSNELIRAVGIHTDSVNKIGVYAGSLIPSNVANSWTPDVVLAKGHLSNIVISSSSLRSSTHSGSFYNVTNKYLPLKFKNNGNTYYGWARLTTNTAHQLTISDYAYNSSPNSPIKSGNTGCNYTPVTPVVTVKGDTVTSSSADKYQWYVNGNLIPGDTLSSVTPPLQQGYYAVLTTDANGCLSESQAKYLSCNIAQPEISESSGFLNPSCVPAEVQAVNLVNGAYIQWLRNDTIIAGATDTTYLADSSGNYSAEFINSAKTCYALSDTVQLTITSLPDPVVSTTNQGVLCPGGVLNISLTDSADYNLSDTLQWYFNGNLVRGANQPIYAVDTSGTYFITITSGACYKSSENTIITKDVEYPTINLKGTDTLLTERYSSYQWYEDSVQAGNGTGQYYYATDSGTYFVIVTDSLGCSFKSPDYFYTNTGIASAMLPEQVTIYAYDKRIHVLFTNENLLGSPLRIYNMLGQEIFSTTLTTGQTEIDMTDFTAGLYVVEVAGKTSSVIKKIVIE